MRTVKLFEDHVPHPTNDFEVGLTVRIQFVLTMAWNGVRFLELLGTTVDFLLLRLGRKHIFPM